LDFLGFPWILSSESRLINELREIFERIFFLSLCPDAKNRGNGQPTIWRAEGRIDHWASLTCFLFFCKIELPPAFALWPPSFQGALLEAHAQSRRHS
jgi:hypothetical protein